MSPSDMIQDWPLRNETMRNHEVVKPNEDAELQTDVFQISTLNINDWSASRSGRLTSTKREPDIFFVMRLVMGS